MSGEGWKTIIDKEAPAGSWVVADKAGVETATGVGLESCRAALDESQILFAVIRIHGVDERESVTSVRPKYCRVNWVGPKVSAVKKIGALQGKPIIAEMWKGTSIEFDADSLDSLEASNLMTRLLDCGGAHKPRYYEFGADEKLEVPNAPN
mmetsp:Transcript_4283/g.3593  ORF Transcript_4283/g.3593 Transcript_4283/m.3593 type:complete len:151 (-) Transcript_4283:126-578(-)